MKTILLSVLLLASFATIPSAAMAAEGDMTTYEGTGQRPNSIAFDGTNMWTVNYKENNTGGGSVTKVSPTGVMTSYATIGFYPTSIAFDGTNLWATDYWGIGVMKISPTGEMTTYKGGDFLDIATIAFDGTNLWMADGFSNSVMKVSPTGVRMICGGGTVSCGGTGMGPYSIAFDGTNVWTANLWADSVTKISPTGESTTYEGTGRRPYAIAFDGTNMWTANFGINTIVGGGVTKVSPTGEMTTYLGPEGGGFSPVSIAFDGTNMWVAVLGNSVAKVSPTGVMTTYHGTGSQPASIAFDGTNMWTANVGDSSVTKIGTGPPSTLKLCLDPCNSNSNNFANGSVSIQAGDPKARKFVACYNTASDCSDASGDITADASTTFTNPNVSVLTQTAKGTFVAAASGTDHLTVNTSKGNTAVDVTVNAICASCPDASAPEAQAVCSGTTYTYHDALCNNDITCNGGRYCDFNWREVRP